MKNKEVKAGPNPSHLCRCGCGYDAPIAKATNTRKGHFKGHPMHFIKGHQNILRKLIEDEATVRRRFDESVFPDPNTGCFIWAGPYLSSGYGSFYFRGDTWPAHRAVWVMENGEILPGLEVTHRCHNRSCVSTEHLRLQTHADNMRESSLLGNCRRGEYPRGVKQNGSGWSARFRTRHLGTFRTIEEAATAAAKARQEAYAQS